MNKTTIASIATTTIDTLIPKEVSELMKTHCSVVIDDLSNWDISPSRHNAHAKDLYGLFGFHDGKPLIVLNHKALKTKDRAIKTTMHEVAHFYLWHLGLANGERATNKLVKQWGGTNL